MGDTGNLILSWRSMTMLMACLPVIICSVLLLAKQVEESAARILAVTLLVSVLSVVPQIIGFAGFYNVWPGLTFFPFATDLLLGPLLYLHARVLLFSAPLGWRKWLVAPGLLQIAYYTWAFFYFADYEAKWAFSERFHVPFIVPAESILGVAFLAISIFMIWKYYGRYQVFLQNTQSDAIGFDPVWLKRIVLIAVIAGLLFSGIELLGIFIDLAYTTLFPVQVLIMLSIAWLSIEAVWRLDQPFPKLSESDLVAATGQRQEQSAQTGALSLEKWREEGTKIEAEVIANEWFLEPRFSLQQLAKLMGSNEAYMSKAINQGLGVSFNEFINRLRVDRAKQLLVNGQPLIQIALDSGFNSKATFNRAFKLYSSQTPSEYRKSKRLKS